VDLEEALAALPGGYAVALQLEAAGESDAIIAAALDLDPASVPALLELGHRKLASLLEDG
jgi:hypothetical protein